MYGVGFCKKLRAARRWVEMDRAIVYASSQRIWRLCASAVTVLLLITHFSPQLQGFYYTFSSLIALQMFAELGLGQVIIQFCSHEWAHLQLNEDGKIVGHPQALSRLVSLGRFVVKWYLVASSIATIGLSVGGLLFFSHSSLSRIHWRLPWLFTCLGSGIMLCFIPVWSVLEGCNQMREVYRFRLTESVVEYSANWLAILWGAGLWTLAAMTVAKIVTNVWILSTSHAKFFRIFFSTPQGGQILWPELWTLQWRFAVSWFAGYAAGSLFIPVVFRVSGPIAAGQMGVTWNMVGAVTLLASTWVMIKAPTAGVLVARKNYAGLDRLMLNSGLTSVTVAAVLAFVAWAGVYVLYSAHFRIASRLLPPLPTGLFLGSAVLAQILNAESVYLRAHKREPLLWLGVVVSTLVVISIVLLGGRFGVTGMASGYLVITGGLAVPVATGILLCCRAQWHSPRTPTLSSQSS